MTYLFCLFFLGSDTRCRECRTGLSPAAFGMLPYPVKLSWLKLRIWSVMHAIKKMLSEPHWNAYCKERIWFKSERERHNQHHVIQSQRGSSNG